MTEGRGRVEEESVDFVEGGEVVWRREVLVRFVTVEKRVTSRDGDGILSCTAFHSCVEFSFDILIIPFAVPLRMKSACIPHQPSLPPLLASTRVNTPLSRY